MAFICIVANKWPWKDVLIKSTLPPLCTPQQIFTNFRSTRKNIKFFNKINYIDIKDPGIILHKEILVDCDSLPETLINV